MTNTPKKPVEVRIYHVIDEAGKPRLVRATSAATAVTQVYKHHVRVASQSDLVSAMKAGVEIE